jgi:indole-3-glycerol phosphate synthase/phosphoribosylanthranilate isomerase
LSFLEKILPAKEAEARQLTRAFAAQPPSRPARMPVRDFAAAISGSEAGPLAVIAEVKHKSPSHPEFRQFASPARLAAAYRRGGAAALSVVTDEANFGTSLADVAAMREASGLPVLVKEFIIDRSQILAAWAAGADAILLIARMLDHERLAELLAEVHDLGLTALVECHDEQDISKSVAAGARVIGINNRNLATLETDIAQTPRLMPLVPEGVIKVSESGIDTREQIERLAESGAHAFLIGHALLMSPDPGRKIRELTGLEKAGRTRVKVCGLTNPADAVLVQELGADILGVVFAASPRQITATQVMGIRAAVPTARLCGVFVDAPVAEVVQVSQQCDLDLVQLHGQESPEYCRELSARTGLPLIKAFTLDSFSTGALEAYREVAYFLVDLPKDETGGPDEQAKEQVRQLAGIIKDTGRQVLLAGGLNPGNVKRGLALAPFAVDVARGVESEPGRKDPAQVAAFLREVR